MAKQKADESVEEPVPNLKLGERVRIKHSDNWQGRIVELWGAIGPGGAQIYRVRIRHKPKPIYIDVREDQLEVIPEEEGGKEGR